MKGAICPEAGGPSGVGFIDVDGEVGATFDSLFQGTNSVGNVNGVGL